MAARIRENPLRALQLPLFFLALGWTVFRRLRREPRVDLVHAHWVIPQGLAALVARRLSGRTVAVLCTSHGGDLFGLKGWLLARLKKQVLERCDGVTVVSTALAIKARELASAVEPTVIPMGTDLEATFTPPPSPRSPPLRRLLFAGRLVPKKGVSHLLEAMARLHTSLPDAVLTIAGDGPLLPELRAQAGALKLDGIVTFAGAVPHAELAELYRQADIAVFPFVQAADGDQEGFGLVMVEAMGCGCAVVASDLPAVRDVIRHRETGFLVPPADAGALAARIAEMVRQPGATIAAATRGTEHARAHFDWRVTGASFANVYRRLEG
jgi:phosphatidyl-myo-inositol dimannoside synthase